MRLLLLTIDFPPNRGGVARYLDALARSFGDELTVVAPRHPDAPAHDELVPYAVIRRQLLRRAGWPRWTPSLRALFRRRASYDIAIVSHVLPLGTAAMLAKFVTGKPYAVIVHGMDIGLAKRSAWKRFLAARVLRGAAVVAANSSALSQELTREFGVSQAIVAYPPLTVPAAPPACKEPGERANILTVARLVSRKGIERALDAIEYLHEEREHRFAYTIMGDGPLRETIAKRVRRLNEKAEREGLDPFVALVSDADDAALYQAYACADAFFLPVIPDDADREGFGMVYLEAAAFGVPSVATRMPGVDEAVLDGETGILVPGPDVHGLVEALRTLLHDAQMRRRLGENARRRAIERFTPQRQFASFAEALKDHV